MFRGNLSRCSIEHLVAKPELCSQHVSAKKMVDVISEAFNYLNNVVLHTFNLCVMG